MPAKFSAKQSSKDGHAVVHETSAGGVVFHRTTRGIQFAVILDSYNHWAFPKGRVEGSEYLEEAAARETMEELGLQEIRLIDSLGKISIWFRDHFEKGGKLVQKDIHYYLFEAKPDAVLTPDPTQHVYKVRWVKIGDVLKVSGYSDMIPILKKAVYLVKHL